MNRLFKLTAMLMIAGAMLMSACDDGGGDEDNNPPVVYEIGDRGPAGGWIFYLNPDAEADGWTYLEAASADLGTGVWGDRYLDVPGSAGTDIGTGEENSLAIINDDSTENKAADMCADYSVTIKSIVYNDWFLPSRDEMAEMYNVLASQDMGGFSDNYYWSSTQCSSFGSAYAIRFSDGMQGQSTKSISTHSIRAIRAF